MQGFDPWFFSQVVDELNGEHIALAHALATSNGYTAFQSRAFLGYATAEWFPASDPIPIQPIWRKNRLAQIISIYLHCFVNWMASLQLRIRHRYFVSLHFCVCNDHDSPHTSDSEHFAFWKWDWMMVAELYFRLCPWAFKINIPTRCRMAYKAEILDCKCCNTNKQNLKLTHHIYYCCCWCHSQILCHAHCPIFLRPDERGNWH